MMAGIDLEINADVSKSLKAIEDFSKQSTSSLQKIEDSFLNLNKSANKFSDEASKKTSALTTVLQGAAGAAGVFLAYFTGEKVIAFFEKAIEAASEQEQATQKLNTALALSGSYTKEASQDLLDFASGLQQATGFTDEQSLSLIALAKSYGISNERAKEVVKVAVDLETTGVDARTSVEGLSKGLLGFKNQLERTRPEIRGLTEEQKKSGAQIDILKNKFAGTAETLTKSFSGAVKLAKVNFGELLETIGQGVIENPFVIAAFKDLSKALVELNEFLISNKKDFIDLVSKGITYLVDSLPGLVRALGFMLTSFQNLSSFIDLVKVGLSTLADGAVTVAEVFTNVFAQIGAFAFLPVIKGVELTVKALNLVGGASDETVQSLEDLTKSTKDVLINGTQAFDGIKDSIKKYGEQAEEDFDKTQVSVAATEKGFNLLSKGAQALAQSVKDSADETQNADEVFKKISATSKAVILDFENQEKALEKSRQAFEDLKKDLEKDEAKNTPFLANIKELEERIKVIDEAFKTGAIKSFQEAEDFKLRVGIDAAKKLAEEQDKITKDQLEREKKRREDFLNDLKKTTSEATSSPLITPTQAERLTGGPQEGSAITQNAGPISQVAGAFASILEGAAGATKLVQSAVSTIADSLLPGIGGAVGQIVGVLAQGPEKVKGFVEEFVKALPDIIKNIALAAPVLVQVLADHAPEIIVAIVKAIPEIIRALNAAAPEIIKSFASLPDILARELVKSLEKEFKKAALKDSLTGLFLDAGTKFTLASQKAGTNLQNNFAESGKSFGLKISEASKNFGTQLSEGGKSFVDTLSNGFKVLGDDLSNFTKNFAGDVAKFLKDLLSPLTSVFSGLPEEINSAFSGLPDQIKASFSGIPESLKAGISQIFSSISLKLPEFKFPAFPKFTFPSLPELKVPSLPELKVPSLPELKLPKFPTLDFNFKIPPIEIPSFSIDIPGLKELTSKAKSIVPNISLPKFAEGGLVPLGFPNDTFAANLSSGETVIDRTLTKRLENFLNNQTSSQPSASPVKVVLQVGEKQLADVLLNLNRQGFRTA